MTDPRRTTVRTGAMEFDVLQAGEPEGTPVILLHGFPETAVSWSRMLPALADAGIWAIAPDQRGYSPGARPPDVASYATEKLAQDVIDIADALDVPAFHLVGHDWGASVGWVVAARWPERLLSYTAASVPHLAAYGEAVRTDPGQQRLSAYYDEFRRGDDPEGALLAGGAARLRAMYGGALPAALEDEYVRHLSEPGALEAALHWYRAMSSRLGALPAVSVPCTFIWGDGDVFIGQVAARRCGDFVDADYRYVELTGVSHWIPEEQPGTFVDEILRRIKDT